MRLSELIAEVESILQEDKDPEIRVVGTSGGFRKVEGVAHRSDYFDNHPAFEGEFETGDFVVLEI